MQIEIEIPKLTGGSGSLEADDKIAAIAYYDAVRSAAGPRAGRATPRSQWSAT